MSKHALVINNIVGRNIWYTWDFTPLLNIALCCRVLRIYCVVYSFFFLPIGSQWWHYLILFVFSLYNISWYIDSVMISTKRAFSVFTMHFTCACRLDYLCCYSLCFTMIMMMPYKWKNTCSEIVTRIDNIFRAPA